MVCPSFVFFRDFSETLFTRGTIVSLASRNVSVIFSVFLNLLKPPPISSMSFDKSPAWVLVSVSDSSVVDSVSSVFPMSASGFLSSVGSVATSAASCTSDSAKTIACPVPNAMTNKKTKIFLFITAAPFPRNLTFFLIRYWYRKKELDQKPIFFIPQNSFPVEQKKKEHQHGNPS